MKTMTKKRAFTLIELLIVIAIIGILFIVLVSKVDFATDKAKATGVQTDFRSFQVALETVARENSGFNTFGWDTGDTNGDRVRNSYDAGDTNQDGVRDAGETWIGRKVYAETWTGVYTLVKPGTSTLDSTAIFALESAINKNLDPKLHITIGTDGVITMANQATDPWKNEYHGRYLSNAAADKLDRGAIIIYSNGANGVNGSADGIASGKVNITNPGNNVQGKDDYAVATFYSYANSYGEIKTITYGFSNNQTFNDAADVPTTPVTEVPEIVAPIALPTANPSGTIDSYSWTEIKALARAGFTANDYKAQYGIEIGQMKDSKYLLVDFDNYGGFVFMYHTGAAEMMEADRSNSGGFGNTDLAALLETTYANLSDTELKAAMKQVTIKCSDGNANLDRVNSYSTHMFVPSNAEVAGTFAGASYDAEGTAFEFFSDDVSRSSIGGGSAYWLRSAFDEDNKSFCRVRSNGQISTAFSDDEINVVAAFVIG